MDQKRLSTATTANRSSALPRPTSRLPQPRASGIPTPTSTVLPVASTEALRGRLTQSKISNEPRASNVANTSRIRTSASREQLKETNSALSSPLRKSQRSIGPPLSSQIALRGARSRSISREPSVERSASEAQDGQLKQPLVLRRRPSGQFISSGLYNESAIDEEGPHDVLPPLTTLNKPSSTITPLGIRSEIKKPGPSLAERTMETLSQLPSSPVVKRRGSNFFDPEAQPRKPSSRTTSGSSRPGSSHQSDTSAGRSFSRPGSSSGPPEGSYSSSRASSNSNKPPLSTLQGTPVKRTSSIVKPLVSRTGASTTRLQSNLPMSTVGQLTPSLEKAQGIAAPKYGAHAGAARPLRPRASIPGLSKKSSLSTLNQTSNSSSELPLRQSRKVSLASAQSSITINTNTSGEERTLSSASTVSTALTADSIEDSPPATARKSSAALREQIAKAKAAKRIASRQPSGSPGVPPLKSPLIPTDTTFDFGLSDDPFNQTRFEDSNRKVMQSRIEMARTTGRLNIAAMGLKQIPDEVVNMYDLESVGYGSSWAESVDLTRFIAADNELETLDDSMFPDTDPMDFADTEDSKGHQFGGLEALDLHGNTLIALPIGLRRLQQLTSLNLVRIMHP
jgi:hypothetical protein